MKKKDSSSASSSSTFSMEKMQAELANLSDADKITELGRRLGVAEKKIEVLADQAANVDKYKKANGLMEEKLKRGNTLLMKTEESKSKLEELCRELQRVNKEIRDDSMARLRTMEDDRAAAVDKLRLSLKDIEHTMQEGHGKSDQLATENARLAAKMNELAGEYKDKLEAFSAQSQEKDKYHVELEKAYKAETALLKAKLESSQLMVRKGELEKEELTRSLLEGTARVGTAIECEKILRDQVKEYTEKYSSLHKSLTASNEAFDKFRKEIDRVNSKLATMEAEAKKWKAKYDEASRNVLVLTLAKKELEDASTANDKRVKTLEALCRELQGRKELAPCKNE